MPRGSYGMSRFGGLHAPHPETVKVNRGKPENAIPLQLHSLARRTSESVPFGAIRNPPLLHIFQITCVGSNASSKNIVRQREHNIEVPVEVSVM